MKRYKFSLQSALRARRAQEDVARQRLALSNHKLQAARDSLAASEDGYRALPMAAGVVAHDVFANDQARQGRAADSLQRARDFVVDAEVEAATCFAAWVESAKQVSSLDRLDERRRAEWRIEELRDEAAAIDDVVTSRWAVRTGGALREVAK
jgi:flagellar export protein FliJ